MAAACCSTSVHLVSGGRTARTATRVGVASGVAVAKTVSPSLSHCTLTWQVSCPRNEPPKGDTMAGPPQSHCRTCAGLAFFTFVRSCCFAVVPRGVFFYRVLFLIACNAPPACLCLYLFKHCCLEDMFRCIPVVVLSSILVTQAMELKKTILVSPKLSHAVGQTRWSVVAYF